MVLVAPHKRAIVPVLGGISGSTKTIWKEESSGIGWEASMIPLQERDIVLLGDGEVTDFKHLGKCGEGGKVRHFIDALYPLFELT